MVNSQGEVRKESEFNFKNLLATLLRCEMRLLYVDFM